MMHVDIPALTASVRARLTTDSAGAAVRTLLGSGALSIIDVEALHQDALPPRPFLALRRGPAPVDGGLAIVTYTWFLYDDPRYHYDRIDALLRPLALAYDIETPADAPIWGGIALQIGDARPDPTLGLTARPVQLAIYAV